MSREVPPPMSIGELERWCIRHQVMPEDLPGLVEQLTLELPVIIGELSSRLHTILRTSQPVLAHVRGCEACMTALGETGEHGETGELCTEGRALFDECRDYTAQALQRQQQEEET